MTNSNSTFKNFIYNLQEFFNFGFKLFRRGCCDKQIDGEYKLIENSENRGYTKIEAANMLNISVRQFDRRIQQGLIPKGTKYKNVKTLYWNKEVIDKMTK